MIDFISHQVVCGNFRVADCLYNIDFCNGCFLFQERQINKKDNRPTTTLAVIF